MDAFDLLLEAWVVLIEDPALSVSSHDATHAAETPTSRDFDVEVRHTSDWTQRSPIRVDPKPQP